MKPKKEVMDKKEFVLTKEEFDLGVDMAKRLLAKKIFKEIEKLGVFSYLTGTDERVFNFNPSEKVWNKLKKELI